jgi:taurine dioxygenase
MDVTVLDPVGAEVTGLRLDELDPGAVAELRALLADHGVVVLPDQHVDDAAFVGFLTRFGALTFTPGETPVPGFGDLNVVSNVGRTVPPRSTFHTDTSYVARPPAYTALRAVEIPARGGDTLFTNQYTAYDTLPDDVVAGLQGRTIRHVVTGVDPATLGPDDETAAEHPVFRPHPVSGRTALFLSSPARCAAVSGLSADESAEAVEFLFAHSTRAENVHRHPWSPGDVVIWDNGCVLHRADHDAVDGDRVLHRGMVAG